jgi:hypothetical protein
MIIMCHGPALLSNIPESWREAGGNGGVNIYCSGSLVWSLSGVGSVIHDTIQLYKSGGGEAYLPTIM